MRPPPAFLPPATSRKWQNRRSRDSLGYVRARSLANPNWPIDARWVAGIIEADLTHPGTSPAVAAALRVALAAVTRYPRTSAGTTDADTSWDEALAAIDGALEVRQAGHLAAVIRAGASGRKPLPHDPRLPSDRRAEPES